MRPILRERRLPVSEEGHQLVFELNGKIRLALYSNSGAAHPRPPSFARSPLQPSQLGRWVPTCHPGGAIWRSVARSGIRAERAMIEADGERRRGGTPLCPAGSRVIPMTPFEWMDERPRDRKCVCCFVQRGSACDEARKGSMVGACQWEWRFTKQSRFYKALFYSGFATI